MTLTAFLARSTFTSLTPSQTVGSRRRSGVEDILAIPKKRGNRGREVLVSNMNVIGGKRDSLIGHSGRKTDS